jgi:hypothetical protein
MIKEVTIFVGLLMTYLIAREISKGFRQGRLGEEVRSITA